MVFFEYIAMKGGYFMSLYDSIIAQLDELEKSKTPISNVAHKECFTQIQTPDTESTDGTYECFRAEKADGDQKVILSITTRDNYRSFGNDEEPYHNTVSVYKDGQLIGSKSYTYYE